MGNGPSRCGFGRQTIHLDMTDIPYYDNCPWSRESEEERPFDMALKDLCLPLVTICLVHHRVMDRLAVNDAKQNVSRANMNAVLGVTVTAKTVGVSWKRL